MRKEIPILFSTPMVQAILQGRKTVTRRVVKLPIEPNDEYGFVFPPPKGYSDAGFAFTRNPATSSLLLQHCPYGKPGDVLWVRESFRKYCHVDENGVTHFDDVRIDFAADNPEPLNLVDADGFLMHNKDGSEKYVPFKPSIHMPKAAARIWLEVVSVRVERLQEITEDGAEAEGIEQYDDGTYRNYFTQKGLKASDGVECLLAKGSFQSLWCSINGLDNWQANPWVWVVEFRVLSTTGRPELGSGKVCGERPEPLAVRSTHPHSDYDRPTNDDLYD